MNFKEIRSILSKQQIHLSRLVGDEPIFCGVCGTAYFDIDEVRYAASACPACDGTGAKAKKVEDALNECLHNLDALSTQEMEHALSILKARLFRAELRSELKNRHE